MGNFLYRLSFKFVLSLIGVILIGCLPALFNGIKIDLAGYFTQLVNLVPNLLNPSEWTYTMGGFERPLFPMILDRWAYSLTLLFCAFFLAFTVALVMAYFTMLLPRKLVNGIKFILFSLESLPEFR